MLLGLWVVLPMTSRGVRAEDEPPPARIARGPNAGELPVDALLLDEDRLGLFAYDDGRVVLYELATGYWIATLRDEAPSAAVIAASADASRIVVCDPASGELFVHELERRGAPKRIPKLAAGAHTAVLSPDGRTLWLGQDEDRLRRIDLDARRPRATAVRNRVGRFRRLRMTPDGERLFLGTDEGRVLAFGSADGKRVGAWDLGGGAILDLDVDAAGAWFIAACEDGSARFCEALDDAEVQTLAAEGEAGYVRCAISGDGLHVATMAADGSMIRWTRATLQTPKIWESTEEAPGAIRLTFDGSGLFAASGAMPRFWSEDGPQTFGRRPFAGDKSSFDEDAGILLYAGTQTTVFVFDLERGEEALRIPTRQAIVSTAWLRAGRRVAIATITGELRIHDGVEGGPAHLVALGGERANVIEALPDGHRLLCGTRSGKVLLIDLREQQPVRELLDLEDEVARLQAAPDAPRFVVRVAGGRTIACEFAESGSLKTWDLQRPNWISISPDGQRIAIPLGDGQIEVRGIEGGRSRIKFESASRPGESLGSGPRRITFFEFSRDGKRLALSSENGLLRTIDLERERVLADIEMAASGRGRTFLAGGGSRLLHLRWDTPLLIHDAESGDFVGAAGPSNFGWAVIDAEGHFDYGGTPANTWHWVQGLSAAPLESVRERRVPGLLAHLTRGTRPPRSRAATTTSFLPPAVRIEAPAPGTAELHVEATNRGGGIGQVEVFLNGKRTTEDARGGTVSTSTEKERFEVYVGDSPYLLPGEMNRVEARVHDASGTVSARGPAVEFEAPGERDSRSRFFAIVCGVSDYAGEDLDLQYSAADAVAMGTALRLSAGGLFEDGDIDIQVLASPAGDGAVPATRANLMRALDHVEAEARAGDVFVVYLSGHGVALDDGYRYLLADAGGADYTQVAPPSAVCLTGGELIERMGRIKAVRGQLVVLDTCAAGAVRDVLKQVAARLWLGENVTADTGAFVLAGCPADRLSYESSIYGQGLLTYSLLHGMQCGCAFRGSPAVEPVDIDVRALIGHARRTVRDLARSLSLRDLQSPVLLEPDGDFLLGRDHARDGASDPGPRAPTCIPPDPPRPPRGIGRSTQAVVPRRCSLPRPSRHRLAG